jgi:hypothetical protein
MRQLAWCFGLWLCCTGLAQTADEEAAPNCIATSSESFAGGTLTIKPGQVLCLRVAVLDGNLTIAQVAAATPKNEVLVLDLSSEQSSTMLVMQNGTAHVIKYSAKFQVPRKAAWHPTSICPVQAGIAGIEQWPHAIQAMQLSDFRVIPKDGDLVCN